MFSSPEFTQQSPKFLILYVWILKWWLKEARGFACEQLINLRKTKIPLCDVSHERTHHFFFHFQHSVSLSFPPKSHFSTNVITICVYEASRSSRGQQRHMEHVSTAKGRGGGRVPKKKSHQHQTGLKLKQWQSRAWNENRHVAEEVKTEERKNEEVSREWKLQEELWEPLERSGNRQIKKKEYKWLAAFWNILHFIYVNWAEHDIHPPKQNYTKSNRSTEKQRRNENNNRQQRQRTRQTRWKGMKGNIPRSEGFEICFCLIVSEREKRRRRESTDRDSEKLRGLGVTKTCSW